jgi:hypothetical protein
MKSRALNLAQEAKLSKYDSANIIGVLAGIACKKSKLQQSISKLRQTCTLSLEDSD